MVLVTQFKDGGKFYRELGGEFHIVYKQVSPDEFEKCKADPMHHDSAYAVVIFGNGSKSEYLFEGPANAPIGNYLLNESGDMFKDLSLGK